MAEMIPPDVLRDPGTAAGGPCRTRANPGRELFRFRFGRFSILDRKAMRERTLEALKTTAV